MIATVPAAADPPIDPLINEWVANHVSIDTHEFVEIVGDADTDYAVFTVLEIEGEGSNAGTVDGVFQIGTTDGAGYWFTGFMESEIENGTAALLLVEGFTGGARGMISTPTMTVPSTIPSGLASLTMWRSTTGETLPT